MRGSELVVKALEDSGARLTFGIPGTHNIELYDALERSSVTPVLVTDEQCASFMADAVSRVSSTVGVANVVPGAGVTHCLSGVAEAYMDGIPLVVLTCGIRQDTGRAYQLHDIDQLAILRPITKAVFKPKTGAEIYPMIRQAFALARSGTPGPVAVEIAADLYLLSQDGGALEAPPEPKVPAPDPVLVREAADILNKSRKPLLYAGWGARDAADLLLTLAERLGAPVATTIQGKGVFPEDHPLWLWNGLGASTPHFVQELSRGSDCWLALGCRFGEVATGSYGFTPPPDLIHADINREVIGRNFPARVAVESDARLFLEALLPLVNPRARDTHREARVAAGHKEVVAEWHRAPSKDRVSPFALFEALQKLSPEAVFTTDSGNGTFLAMEHLRLKEPRRFLGPIDFSCMGYSIPAAVGAKLACPAKDVIALAGDGALLMTGLELITATHYKAAPLIVVLRDGELGQIAQFQRAALNRDTCSVLAPYDLQGLCAMTGARYFRAAADAELSGALEAALVETRSGRPALVEAAIDYSRKTYFTRGVVSTNFWRLPWGDRVKALSRAVSRKLTA